MPSCRVRMGPRPGATGHSSAERAAATGAAYSVTPLVKRYPVIAAGAGTAYAATTQSGDDPAWVQDLRSHWDGVSITATSTVPGTIPHDGTTAAGTALQTWIDAQPSGTGPTELRRYDFTTNLGASTILLNGRGMDFRGKSNIQIYLPNTTWRLLGTGASNFENFIMTGNGHDVWVYGGGTCLVDGENPATGTQAASPEVEETLTAINHRCGSQYVRVQGMEWDNLRGFGPITSGKDNPTVLGPPTNIWWHDCIVRGAEMGLAWVSGNKCLAENLTVLDSCFNAMDIEPDEATDRIEDIYIKNNTFENFGWGQTLTPWFFSSVPGGNGEEVEMYRVSVLNNDVTQTPLGNRPTRGGLRIRCDDPNNKYDYVIVDNTTDYPHTESSAVMRFTNIHGSGGLRVQGNTQPITAGSLVSASDCSPLVTTPNDTTP